MASSREKSGAFPCVIFLFFFSGCFLFFFCFFQKFTRIISPFTSAKVLNLELGKLIRIQFFQGVLCKQLKSSFHSEPLHTRSSKFISVREFGENQF